MDKFLVTGSYLHSQKEEIIPRTDGDKPRDKVSANGSACAALTMSVEDINCGQPVGEVIFQGRPGD